MKNIFRTFAVLTATVALAACDLTLLPEDKVTPDVYFKTETDLQRWSNYYYSYFVNPETSYRYSADDLVKKSMGSIIEGTRMASDAMSGDGQPSVRSTISWKIQTNVMMKVSEPNMTDWHTSSEHISISRRLCVSAMCLGTTRCLQVQMTRN